MMERIPRILGLLALFTVPVLAQDAAPVRIMLSLKELSQTAMKSSPRLKAAYAEYGSARAQAHSLGDMELPRLGLEGYGRYMTEIPSFSPAPAIPARPFGDNLNYGISANLNWTLWDFRSLHSQAESATLASEAKGEAFKAAGRQVLMALRLSYFQTQIALEQVRLLGDSLKVAQAQYEDIQRQARAGAASRMDLLSAHQESLDYRRQFTQAQASLANALRDLAALAGTLPPGDLSRPLDARMEGKLPQDIQSPSAWIAMDPREDSLKVLSGEAQSAPDDSVPQLKTYARLAESARKASEAVHSQLFPRITLSARSGFEYPNGPVLETIQQNVVGVSLSMPLFDWGGIVEQSEAQRRQSQAYLSDLDQARLDLRRDWDKAQDLLSSLKVQQDLDRTAVAETAELAALSYTAYQAGRLRFLEVESANFRALGAKVQSLRDDLQVLMQMSVLSSLSGKEQP